MARRGAVDGTRVTDAADFDHFYRAEYLAVVKFVFVLTGQWHVAEEVAQEVFMRALARWDGQLDRPAAWVRTVALNLARSRFRRVQTELRALTRLGRMAPDEANEDTLGDEHADFWAAVRTLPRRQAQAVALYYLEDRSVADVARLMACAEGTAKALLHQARQRLAQQLGATAEVQR